ncbi:hypothetical protein [Thalassoroseus pseudoceratinae]|uniref:hypothetical protein n=1 Tax=Thalassoroseus pseudoceratinae TaxID=2713176 RepID=UPI001420DA72|nr:hypothetical protein [Thalassoroseus pseudoceratinae]
MKIFSTGLLICLVFPTLAFGGRPRNWEDPSGETLVRGEYFGCRNGQVVISLNSVKKLFPLSAFSLEDRDYLVDLMLKRKHERLLAQLMDYENSRARQQVAAASGIPGFPRPNIPGVPNFPEAPGFPGNTAETPQVDLRPQANVPERDVYGLTVPTPELLEEEAARVWTDLRGSNVSAVYLELVAPAHVKLRTENGQVSDFALVNFVRDDIDYIKEAIKKDQSRDVFPVVDQEPLTTDQKSDGYRTWTDRNGRTLGAKFVRVFGKEVVLDVDGENQNYRIVGLSDSDRDWVNAELRRKAAEKAAQSSEIAGNGPPGIRNFGPPANPYQPGVGASGPGSHAEQASRDEVPPGYDDLRTGGGFLTYQNVCRDCGYKFVTSSHAFECPKCKEQRRQQRNSTPSWPSNQMASGSHMEMETPDITIPTMPEPSLPDFSSSFGSSGIKPGLADHRTDKISLVYYEFDCEHCNYKWAASEKYARSCPKCHKSFGGGFSGVGIVIKLVIAAVVFLVVKFSRGS